MGGRVPRAREPPWVSVPGTPAHFEQGSYARSLCHPGLQNTHYCHRGRAHEVWDADAVQMLQHGCFARATNHPPAAPLRRWAVT